MNESFHKHFSLLGLRFLIYSMRGHDSIKQFLNNQMPGARDFDDKNGHLITFRKKKQ